MGEDEGDHVRALLCTFLAAEGAYRTVHKRAIIAEGGHVLAPPRSLGDHLLGTYDILREAGCSVSLQVAGALHSIYGTRKFKRVTVEPNAARRAEIAATFGERAEFLAFLFHATDRPRCIDEGSLVRRVRRLLRLVLAPKKLASARPVTSVQEPRQPTRFHRGRLGMYTI